MKRNIFLSLIALFLSTSALNAQNNDEMFKKLVVVEEFSTEYCPSCPPVARALHAVAEDSVYSKLIIPIVHHSGAGTDFLTTPADTDLRWFYNYKSCYAPGMMFDRYPFYMTRGGKNAKPTAVGGYHEVLNEGYIKEMVDTCLTMKANVGMDLKADFDGSSKITVTVNCVKNDSFISDDPRIWVYLTEDNIQSYHQSGADSDYMHHHALRTYNKVWGDFIIWDGDNFEYTCVLDIADEYNQENLNVVAFVSTFDPVDPSKCVIENGRSIPFAQILSINDVQTGRELVKTEYFTVDGMRTTLGAQGMYVQKKTYADGTTEVKKIML